MFLLNFILNLNFYCSAYSSSSSSCSSLMSTENSLKFALIKSFSRSLEKKMYIANTETLAACMELARFHKGLALNYSPHERKSNGFKLEPKTVNRAHYWQLAEEYFNCHVLQCPENATFKTLINDFRFDYYSLYSRQIENPNYKCIPEVGLFALHTTAETYENASWICRNMSSNYCSGSLAHVASAKRTQSLGQLILDYNEKNLIENAKTKVNFAYIGLYSNISRNRKFEFFNEENENLKEFNYRAWDVGNPKKRGGDNQASRICVILTSGKTWLTVDCKRKHPFICELFTNFENYP